MTAPNSDDPSGGKPATTSKPSSRRITSWDVRPAGDGFGIHGDGRLLRTPAGHGLVVPTRALAEVIADEFRAQATAKVPNFTAMPNLRLAATAIDQVARARDAMIDAVTAFGETELLCYRAEHPGDLVERQHGAWQPLLDWAAVRFAAPLCNTAGVMPRPQAPAALQALRAAVANYDDHMLAGLAFAVQTSGSLVIGLAMAEERLDARQAFDIAELEESYQIEQWGEDAEAVQRRATRRKDLQQAVAYMALVRNAPPRQSV
jgi:chaperone required for assembly of F1-ATPase